MEQTVKSLEAQSYRRTIRFISVSFVSLLLVLIAVCLFSYIQASNMQRSYNHYVLRSYEQLEQVNTLFSIKEQRQNNLRKYISSAGNSESEALQLESQKLKSASRDASLKLNKLLTNQPLKQELWHINQLEANYSAYIDTVMVLAEGSGIEKATAYKGKHLPYAFNLYQSALIRLSNHITAASAQQTRLFMPKLASVVDEYALLLLVALALAIGAAFVLKGIFERLHHENSLLNAEITERLQLQKALQENKEQYRVLFESNPLPMWTFDQKTLKFLDVNKAAEAGYGYTRNEFLNLSLLDISPGSGMAGLKEELPESQRTHSSSGIYIHKNKAGKVFKASVKSNALPAHGSVAPRLVVATNVQEQFDALEKLEESEKQLREISSSIPGAVYQFLVDKDRNFSFPFMSEGICKLIGFTPEEATASAEAVFQNVHPEDYPKLIESIFQSYEEMRPWELEFRVGHKGKDKDIWIRGHSLPSANEDGTVSWNGTLIDITHQKQAQERLYHSEANLRALLDSSPQAIFLLNQNMQIVAYNAVAAADVTKCLFKKLRTGQNILNLVDSALQEQVTDNHSKAMQGQAVLYESGIGESWHEIAFRPVFADNNAVVAVALSIHDISEQKKALETIQRRGAQLARAQQLAKLGNWEYDLQKEMLVWSDGLYSIYGLDKNQFVPTFFSLEQFTPPEERKYITRKYDEAIKQQTIIHLERRVVLADNSERLLHEVVEPIFDQDGTPVKLTGTVQDITSRVQTEREVRQAKNLLQSTLENIPEIIFSADENLKLTYVSPQCLEITGYTEKEFLRNQKLWLHTMFYEDKKSVLPKLTPGLLAGQRQQHEVRVQTRTGEIKWLLLRLSPMLDASGKVLRIDGSAADMTLYKEEETKRQQMTDQLLRQNKNLQQFAYIVSHNLRAPIANLLGLTSIINLQQPDIETNHRVVSNLAKSAQLLDTTIRDLNHILTVQSDLQQIKEKINLQEVVQQVLVAMPADSAEAEVAYDFSAAPVLFSIRSYVQSIITNLISNAFKYKSQDRKLHLHLKTSDHTAYICLSVSDNGLGIDLEKTKDKLFGLYKRFHPSIEGKGIGLHLVKTQAELLEGKVEVKSTVGVGTTFNIYFKK